MDTSFIENQKKALEKELKNLETQIKQGKNFPDYGISLDDNILEMETYQENKSLENKLKTLVKQTKAALKKIEQDKYGICDKCGSVIERGRLKAYPAAAICVTCAKK